MTKFDIAKIAEEINRRATSHAIGSSQELRVSLKGLSRRPSQQIFTSQTIHDGWAFHLGGRTELQFNIGLEEIDGRTEFRHGVAFSFERSQTLPSIDVLLPKVRRFNDFMRLNAKLYRDMSSWHFDKRIGKVRGPETVAGPLSWELVADGVFAFMGKRSHAVDYGAILGDFDRLLPLYRYVESAGVEQPIATLPNAKFTFRPGCATKGSATTASLAARELDINLRHNVLQAALSRRLIERYGKKSVAEEHPSGAGTKVDAIVRDGDVYRFYEIKTSAFPRACIREAIGQLLEYSFWPGVQQAVALVVVGESATDQETEAYLSELRRRFSLPISYEQIVVG
ncbi:MAG: hypothetical protein HOP13_09750 [Alphaproteobacteria bacterium]|nr:hypothetical protein [Alphaproteobacteria bacterium]